MEMIIPAHPDPKPQVLEPSRSGGGAWLKLARVALLLLLANLVLITWLVVSPRIAERGSLPHHSSTTAVSVNKPSPFADPFINSRQSIRPAQRLVPVYSAVPEPTAPSTSIEQSDIHPQALLSLQ